MFVALGDHKCVCTWEVYIAHLLYFVLQSWYFGKHSTIVFSYSVFSKVVYFRTATPSVRWQLTLLVMQFRKIIWHANNFLKFSFGDPAYPGVKYRLKVLIAVVVNYAFDHRRRSSLNFGGGGARHFCRKIWKYETLTECPNFTWYLPINIFSRIWGQLLPLPPPIHLLSLCSWLWNMMIVKH